MRMRSAAAPALFLASCVPGPNNCSGPGIPRPNEPGWVSTIESLLDEGYTRSSDFDAANQSVKFCEFDRNPDPVIVDGQAVDVRWDPEDMLFYVTVTAVGESTEGTPVGTSNGLGSVAELVTAACTDIREITQA